MEKSIATRLLKDTLQSPFDEAKFRQFVRNLVNDLNEDKAFTAQGNYIKDAYKHQVRQYKRIGQYVDPEKNTIDILGVRLQQPTTLDRARTMQRNFIAQYLQDRGQKEAALVAYYTDNSPDWRFSLVRLDYRLVQQADGSYKPQKEVTAARRSSFLVGQTEPNHTAQQQLLPLLLNDRHNPTLDELEAAFTIESVTKEFFERYKNLFLQVRDEVEGLRQNDPIIASDFAQKQIDSANFAKKLLGQIVFLYFLQKKGWLGVEVGQPWGSGARDFLRRLFDRSLFQPETVVYDNFFNDVLEPLFYQALAIDRGGDALYDLSGCQQPCKIPFLNGGLFEPIGGYDWQTTNVLIANQTIQNILDTFDLYNFTVREDEPLDKEVAVDPEMLGKVFENLLEVSDRKSKGAFYTPREIVHYMCQESLINYLDTTLNPQVLREDLEQLIRQGERAIENDGQVVKKGHETSKYQFQVSEAIRTHAAAIDRALANIKICDPAIGSGAFPVGMMQEIVKAREVLKTYLPDQKRTTYDFKRHAIQTSIYGVDIDAGAVDIAKLRLWLSLVVDEENYESIKPLPNLDYKIVCGNSLLSVEKNLFNHQLFAELEQQKQAYFEETNPDRKAELRASIQGLIKTITNQDETFDFEVYFSEVLQQQGGFDVVIGNPPYIGQKGNNTLFKPIKESALGKFHQRRMDYFYFFFHQAINISRINGIINYITTNYYITATYADILRKDFKERTIIRELINFNELKIFGTAQGQHNIITFLTKGNDINQPLKVINTKRTELADSKILNQVLHGYDNYTSYFSMPNQLFYDGKLSYIRLQDKTSSKLDIESILDKIGYIGKPLCNYCNITQGIVTGADKLSKSHINKYQIDGKIGDGIFILSKREVESLCLSASEKQFLKPWFKSSDINKWFSNKHSEEDLIYYTSKEKSDVGENLHHHFEKYKPILINRNTRSGTPIIKPDVYDVFVKGGYEISYVMVASAFKRGAYYCVSYARDTGIDYFESPKIIAPQRSKTNTFAYNEIPWYASADVYFMTEKNKSFDLKYILALLNSRLYFQWLYHRGKLKGNSLELYLIPLSEIPIKEVSIQDQKPFIDIVNKIITITEDANYLDNSAKQVQVKEYERQIDQMVYELYELTEEEIKIVEGESEA